MSMKIKISYLANLCVSFTLIALVWSCMGNNRDASSSGSVRSASGNFKSALCGPTSAAGRTWDISMTYDSPPHEYRLTFFRNGTFSGTMFGRPEKWLGIPTQEIQGNWQFLDGQLKLTYSSYLLNLNLSGEEAGPRMVSTNNKTLNIVDYDESQISSIAVLDQSYTVNYSVFFSR